MSEGDVPSERQPPSAERVEILAQGRQQWQGFRGGLLLGFVVLKEIAIVINANLCIVPGGIR